MTHILITGSRTATTHEHSPTIRAALHNITRTHFGPHTLWHGDAPGADLIARDIAGELDWNIEPIPADWDGPCRNTCARGHRKLRRNRTTYCPAAGNYRNQALVDAVTPHLPDVQAYAFPLPGSRGTWDCVRRVKAAGIPIEIVDLAAAVPS
jgi:hypothetical protein